MPQVAGEEGIQVGGHRGDALFSLESSKVVLIWALLSFYQCMQNLLFFVYAEGEGASRPQKFTQ